MDDTTTTVQQAPASLDNASHAKDLKQTGAGKTPPSRPAAAQRPSATRRTAILSTSPAAMVNLADLEEDPHNARQTFEKASLQRLADSIKAQGLLYALVVRKVGDKYRIVDGHRRYRAAQLAGLTQVRCEVLELDDQDAALAAATANLQREDLTPYEQARAFQAALDAGMQKKELCERAGIVFNTLKARLQLLELPEAIGQRIDDDGFTIQHAQAFIPLKDHPELLQAAAAALPKGDDLPNANRMPGTLAYALSDTGKVRRLGEGYNSWEHHGLEKKLMALPHVVLGNPKDTYDRQVLVLDPKAYDEVVQAAEKAKNEKRAKERAESAAHNKATNARNRREAQIRDLTEKEARRLQLAAMVGHLKTEKAAASALFVAMLELTEYNALPGITTYGSEGAEESIGTWKAAAATAGADVEAVGNWLTERGEAGDGIPKWFTALKPARQLTFCAALIGGAILDTHSDDDLVEAVTGKKAKEWQAKGRKEAERTLAAANKPEKPTPAAKPKGDHASLAKAKAKLAKKAA